MSSARSRVVLREVLARAECVTAAPVFNAYSARMAQAGGWSVAQLSSDVVKAANFALPGGVGLVASSSDFADVVRRVRRVATDMALCVDIDDAGGSRVHAYRAVQELEDAGASAIEITDRVFPVNLAPGLPDGVARGGLHDVDEQVAILRTALSRRTDPNLVVVARTGAYELGTHAEARARLGAYAGAGVDAISLAVDEVSEREEIEAVSAVAGVPVFVVGMSDDLAGDKDFLARNRVLLRYVGQPVFRLAAQAIYRSLNNLRADGNGTDDGGQAAFHLDLLRVKLEKPEDIKLKKLFHRWSEFYQADQMYT